MQKAHVLSGPETGSAGPWKISDYDFKLPPALVAERPIEPRDAARLLVVGDRFENRLIGDLPSLLKAGDVLVLNDTRVIPARLEGRRRDARVEVTLHQEEKSGDWRAFARPARKLAPGDRIDIASDFVADVVAKGEGGEVVLRFNVPRSVLGEQLNRYGAMPLPPYIKRPSDDRDSEDYQTVYASHDGAVAAPTAGLHFTEGLLNTLSDRGIKTAHLTLHVGAGTFLPVKVDDIRRHRMHAEWGQISAGAAEAINQARQAGSRIVAIGTTSLRLLESAATKDGRVHPFDGTTDIFIYPGYRFRTADMLLTNFHLPKSTLFMLVAAFAELSRMRAAYKHAIEAKYRFYSYGDACLLHRIDR